MSNTIVNVKLLDISDDPKSGDTRKPDLKLNQLIDQKQNGGTINNEIQEIKLDIGKLEEVKPDIGKLEEVKLDLPEPDNKEDVKQDVPEPDNKEDVKLDVPEPEQEKVNMDIMNGGGDETYSDTDLEEIDLEQFIDNTKSSKENETEMDDMVGLETLNIKMVEEFEKKYNFLDINPQKGGGNVNINYKEDPSYKEYLEYYNIFLREQNKKSNKEKYSYERTDTELIKTSLKDKNKKTTIKIPIYEDINNIIICWKIKTVMI